LFAAACFMVLAALLDVADGALARALRVHSVLGKDLDSLADAVTFGVLPSFMVVVALRYQGFVFEWWTALPCCLAICAVLRLARFNNDPTQARYFRGLPSPAAALAMLGPVVQVGNTAPYEPHWVINPGMLLLWSAGISAAMVSRVPLISFKLGFKTTWPYWLAILGLGLGSMVWLRGGFSIATTALYVVVSQAYFRRYPSAL